MKLILTIGMALTLAAGAALAQRSGCNMAMGCASMSGSGNSGGLAAVKLVSITGDTVRLAEHIGMMPMVMVLAGTDAASAKAVDAVQAAVSARELQPMLVYVIAAGPRPTAAFAKSHNLTGLVLVDQKRTALAAAMADTLPLALFVGQSGNIVKAEAKISEASVNEGIEAMAQGESKLTDPVCGMSVTKETAAGSYTYQGKTYYFCSQSCKDNFVKDPQKYAAK